jgi:hypothetical protein
MRRSTPHPNQLFVQICKYRFESRYFLASCVV